MAKLDRCSVSGSNPLPIVLFTPKALDRFWAKVDKSGDCWNFSSLNHWGYGQFFVKTGRKTKAFSAHRVAWFLSGRSLIHGLVLDHLCNNPACVNPEHMQQVTNAVNVKRAFPPREVCKQGHPMSGDNVSWRLNKRVNRKYPSCRECSRISARRRRELSRSGEVG